MQADTPYLGKTPGALFQTHSQHLFQAFYRRVYAISAEVGKRNCPGPLRPVGIQWNEAGPLTDRPGLLFRS